LKNGLVKEYLTEHRPSIVINAAAFTAVDRCETEKEAAFEVNAIGPKNLATVCGEEGITIGPCKHRLCL